MYHQKEIYLPSHQKGMCYCVVLVQGIYLNPALGYIAEENENTISNKIHAPQMHMLHSSTIYHSQNIEATWVSSADE